jgi:plastocyanin
MKKLPVVIAFVALLAIAGAGFFVSKDASKPAGQSAGQNQDGTDPKTLPQVDLTTQSEVTINIKDYLYDKPNIKIKKGTTVTWVNQDAMQHNAMREHDGEEHAHSAPNKSEVRDDLFAGPLLSRGESYGFTFTKAESLTYHCAPHPYMKGAITVVE